ncbi:MAG: hypothetical protein WKF79_10950 [Nocardioides sp.]
MRPADPRVCAVALTLLTVLAMNGCTGDEASEADRQAAVAERGEDVMGFDLEATVHRFSPTDTGGVQDVVARDPRDAVEIADVRSHLEAQAEKMSRGDFSSPAAIHGGDMPGLEQLEGAGDSLTVDYEVLPDGARVNYSSADADVVAALHDWFDAQLGDHGDDAEKD